jgi:hypothetical protein
LGAIGDKMLHADSYPQLHPYNYVACRASSQRAISEFEDMLSLFLFGLTYSNYTSAQCYKFFVLFISITRPTSGANNTIMTLGYRTSTAIGWSRLIQRQSFVSIVIGQHTSLTRTSAFAGSFGLTGVILRCLRPSQIT